MNTKPPKPTPPTHTPKPHQWNPVTKDQLQWNRPAPTKPISPGTWKRMARNQSAQEAKEARRGTRTTGTARCERCGKVYSMDFMTHTQDTWNRPSEMVCRDCYKA